MLLILIVVALSSRIATPPHCVELKELRGHGAKACRWPWQLGATPLGLQDRALALSDVGPTSVSPLLSLHSADRLHPMGRQCHVPRGRKVLQPVGHAGDL